MPTWIAPDHQPPAELRLDATGLHLTTSARATWPVEALDHPSIRLKIQQIFGLVGLAEVLTCREVGAVAPAPPLPVRPTVPRLFQGPGAWMGIVGRRVEHLGRPAWTAPFEAVLADGLPAELAERLGAEATAALQAAVATLAPLPCPCGTGAESLAAHGQLRLQERLADVGSTVAYEVTTAQCTVCGRWWTFEESGDDRYETRSRARSFDPGAP